MDLRCRPLLLRPRPGLGPCGGRCRVRRAPSGQDQGLPRHSCGAGRGGGRGGGVRGSCKSPLPPAETGRDDPHRPTPQKEIPPAPQMGRLSWRVLSSRSPESSGKATPRTPRGRRAGRGGRGLLTPACLQRPPLERSLSPGRSAAAAAAAAGCFPRASRSQVERAPMISFCAWAAAAAAPMEAKDRARGRPHSRGNPPLLSLRGRNC